jgi:hypothetical protein
MAHKKTGPKGPMKPMDDAQFETAIGMARIDATKNEMCAVLRLSEKTLSKRLKERGFKNFSDFYGAYQSEGNVSLRRGQFQKAMSGDTQMLIHLGKVRLGQDTRVKVEGHDGDAIKLESKVTFDVSGLPTELKRAILGKMKLGEDGLPDESESD